MATMHQKLMSCTRNHYYPYIILGVGFLYTMCHSKLTGKQYCEFNCSAVRQFYIINSSNGLTIHRNVKAMIIMNCNDKSGVHN